MSSRGRCTATAAIKSRLSGMARDGRAMDLAFCTISSRVGFRNQATPFRNSLLHAFLPARISEHSCLDAPHRAFAAYLNAQLYLEFVSKGFPASVSFDTPNPE